MPRRLQYESKPVRSEATSESRRKAIACFVCAGLLAVAGVGLCGFAVWMTFWVRGASYGASRGKGRLAAYTVVLAFMIFGGAIERANAGFYHLSGFETRRRHRDN